MAVYIIYVSWSIIRSSLCSSHGGRLMFGVSIRFLTSRPSQWCPHTGWRRRQTDRCTRRRTQRIGTSCRSCTQRRKNRTWATHHFLVPTSEVDMFVPFTWMRRRAADTSRQTNTAWRAGARGWTGQSPPPGPRLHKTRPCSPPGWQTASPCELGIRRRLLLAGWREAD